MKKILKITFKKCVIYSSSYNRSGNKWEAFILGTGWRKYSKAVEIEVNRPDCVLSLAAAARQFGEDVAADLIDHMYSYYTAERLAYCAGHFWDQTYEKGAYFPANKFLEFVRYDTKLATFGYYLLDVVETDRLLKTAYREEYASNMSMADFIEFKFGKETRDAYASLLCGVGNSVTDVMSFVSNTSGQEITEGE